MLLGRITLLLVALTLTCDGVFGQIFQRRYELTQDYEEHPLRDEAMVEIDRGLAAVGGTIRTNSGTSRIHILVVDPAGDVRWSYSVGDDEGTYTLDDMEIVEYQESPSSPIRKDIMVLGHVSGGSIPRASADIVLIRIRPFVGIVNTVRFGDFDLIELSAAIHRNVTTVNNNEYVIVGQRSTSGVPNDRDLYVFGVDASCNRLYERYYHLAGTSFIPEDICQSSGASSVVAGTLFNSATNLGQGMFIADISASGVISSFTQIPTMTSNDVIIRKLDKLSSGNYGLAYDELSSGGATGFFILSPTFAVVDQEQYRTVGAIQTSVTGFFERPIGSGTPGYDLCLHVDFGGNAKSPALLNVDVSLAVSGTTLMYGVPGFERGHGMIKITYPGSFTGYLMRGDGYIGTSARSLQLCQINTNGQGNPSCVMPIDVVNFDFSPGTPAVIDWAGTTLDTDQSLRLDDDKPSGEVFDCDLGSVGTFKRTPVSLEESTSSGLKAYPNPTVGLLNVDLGSAYQNRQVRLSLIDLAGKEVWSANMANGTSSLSIDMSSFGTGLYILKVQSAAGAEKIRINKR